MKTLPELIIDGFDAEQVWAGVDLQNRIKFENFTNQIQKLTRQAIKSKDKISRTNNVNGDHKYIKKTSKHNFDLLLGAKFEVINDESQMRNDQDEDDLHELDIDRWSLKKSTQAAPEFDVEIGMFLITIRIGGLTKLVGCLNKFYPFSVVVIL